VDPLIKPVRKLLAADIKKIAKPIFPVSLSAHNRIQARKSRVRLIGFRVNEKNKNSETTAAGFAICSPGSAPGLPGKRPIQILGQCICKVKIMIRQDFILSFLGNNIRRIAIQKSKNTVILH
jgi:hypothetical protein